MNIGRIKALCWITVMALGSYLGWDVYQFISVGQAELRNLSNDEQNAVLKSVEAPKVVRRRIVSYDKVNETFWKLNWTGKLPAKKPVVEKQKDVVKKRPVKPVSDLLTVVLIKFSSKTEWSNASVHYKSNVDEHLMQSNSEVVLFEGDKLPGKYSFISVASIKPDAVEFAFEDQDGEESREPESVKPPEYQYGEGIGSGITRVDENGKLLMPERESLIPINDQTPEFNYDETREIRKGQFVIGTKDAENFGRNYSSILSREMETGRYRDPKTNRYSGIQVKRISAGSIVSSHGLQAGDIIKSINGDPVTSTQEAIKYVKTNSDVTSHWVALVERQGKDITLTYDYTPTN
ncbi:MAG: hypothetical protein ACI8TQ_000677 [Planctomycetota bacterium]|jgi:hypothetical protein